MHTAVNLFRSNTDDGVFGGKHEFSIFFRLPDIIDGRRPVLTVFFRWFCFILFAFTLHLPFMEWTGNWTW